MGAEGLEPTGGFPHQVLNLARLPISPRPLKGFDRYTFLMACSEYKALLPRQAKGQLSADQERLLKDHLRACDSCRSTLRLLRMDDKAISGALLGLRPRGDSPPPPRRSYRMLLFGTAGILLALIALYGAYRGVEMVVNDDSGPWGSPPEPPGAAGGQAALVVEITWEGALLGDALEVISQATGLAVVMDPPSRPMLMEAVPGSRPFAGSARAILTAVLHPAGLAWDSRFGVILVGSPSRLGALPVKAPALPPSLSDKLVTLSFSGLPLGRALDALSRMKGVEIVLTARVAALAATDRITVAFRNLHFGDALSLILLPRGLTYREAAGMIVVERLKKAQ